MTQSSLEGQGPFFRTSASASRIPLLDVKPGPPNYVCKLHFTSQNINEWNVQVRSGEEQRDAQW